MSVRLLIAARVDGIVAHSPRVRGVRVRPVHRDRFPPFLPGDHVQLQHENGMRRDYSLISSPSEPEHYDIAIQREPHGRGGSVLFHTQLEVGDTVFVSYPQPGLRIDERADAHLFIAGGIGITAIAGLAHALPAGGRATVHFAVRHPDDVILIESLTRQGLDVVIHASSRGERLDLRRVVDEAPPGTTIYACGPDRLLRALDDATAGWPHDRVRSEQFAGIAVADEVQGAPFTARLLGAKLTIEVGERESLLRALRRVGIPVDYSCESGVCGSCVLEVAAGDLEHRDLCLSEEERARGFMTACISRGLGPIDLLI